MALNLLKNHEGRRYLDAIAKLTHLVSQITVLPPLELIEPCDIEYELKEQFWKEIESPIYGLGLCLKVMNELQLREVLQVVNDSNK